MGLVGRWVRSLVLPTGPDRAPEGGEANDDLEPHDGRRRVDTLGLVLVVGLPILVLIAVLAHRTWYPTGDLAQAELRMRSLPRHPPLVGAAGRIVDKADRQGNHPGPLMFWATWPLYELFGRSSWAFEAATATVNLAWLAVATWLVRRRASLAVAVWFVVVMLVLLGGFGLDVLSQPWNPWVALLPFVVLVLTAWRSLDGWRWSPVVAVIAASYAIQGHAGYAPVAMPLVLVSVVAPLWHWYRSPVGGDGDPTSRLPLGPLVAMPFVAILLWLGPLWDAVTSTPSNFQKLVDNFGSPTDPQLGVSEGIKTVLRAMSPFGAWLRGGILPSGSIAPGLLLLLTWAGVAIAVRVVRPDDHRLLQLDAIVGLTLTFGIFAVTRIFGTPYLYVYRWITVLEAFVVFTLGWGIVVLLPRPPPSALRAMAITGACVAVLLSAFTTVRVSRQEIPYPYSWRMEQVLAPAVAPKLDKDRRYLVDWADPVYLGGLGHGLILDLERRGFTVGAKPRYSAAVEPHRVMCPGHYDAVLTAVTGPVAIAKWKTMRGTRLLAQVGSVDGFDYSSTFSQLRRKLAAAGIRYTAADLEQRLSFVLLNADAPPSATHLASELVSNGVPTAVFLQDPAPAAPPVEHTPQTEPCWK
jgi:hypothetical protein